MNSRDGQGLPASRSWKTPGCPGFHGVHLRGSARGARIGTTPFAASATAGHPSDLEMVMIRGNVETRLGKNGKGESGWGCTCAAAGLRRLGFAGLVTEYLPVEISLPATGQEGSGK